MVLLDSTDRATEADPEKATAFDEGSYDAVTARVSAPGAAAARSRGSPTRRTKPILVILTAGAETDATQDAAQTQLAALSTNSSRRVVEGASHAGMVNEEPYAKTTARAVLDVVASVRSAAQLAR